MSPVFRSCILQLHRGRSRSRVARNGGTQSKLRSVAVDQTYTNAFVETALRKLTEAPRQP